MLSMSQYALHNHEYKTNLAKQTERKSIDQDTDLYYQISITGIFPLDATNKFQLTTAAGSTR